MMLIGFVTLRGWDPAPLETFRLQVFDYYQILKPRKPLAYPAIIVDIDDRSLEKVGQWPWPRNTIAKLVERVADGGAKAMAFDILFAEPDRMSPGVVANALTAIDEATRQKLAQLPTNEQILARSFARLPVVVGEAGTLTPASTTAGIISKSAPVATLGGDPKPLLVSFPGLTRNVPELDAAAAGHGMISIRPERDGVIRRVPTVMNVGNKIVPSLSMALLRAAHSGSTILVKRDEAGVQGIGIGPTRLSTDRNAQLWVHFSRRDPRRYVSAVDLLDGRLPPDRLKDKLVLIGTSAAGLFDLRATPLDRVMPGVEIHAQQLESILTGGQLTRPHYALGAEVTMAIGTGLLIIVLAPLLGAFPILVLGGLVAALMGGLSWYLFDQQQVLLDAVYPSLSSFLIFLVLTYVNYVREEAQRTQIRTAFGQYLSPELVSQLAKDPDKLVLGGETREITVLFSDVRGFTSIAESFRNDPTELTNLMNRLLTPLSNAIIERQGTIDKYMGDAVMAFWNAPLDDADHATHAGEAALLMFERVEALNQRLEQEARSAGRRHLPMEFGIGIATGNTVVGNMGSDLRFDYSVLGDTVNLASRLEGLTAQLQVPNLISETTARAVDGQLAVVEVDLVRVKGKSNPERVFSIIGGQALTGDAAFKRFRDGLDNCRELYRSRSFDECHRFVAELDELSRRFGVPGIVEVYRARCDNFLKNPPEEAWDGVYNAETK